MWIAVLFIFSSMNSYSGETCESEGTLSRNLNQIASSLSSDLITECQLPEPGSSKDVDLKQEDSLTGVEHAYRLVHREKGTFEIHFNVAFYRDDSDGEPAEEDKELSKQWRSTIRKCLKRTDGRIRGPNLEKIKLRIYEGPDDEAAPPKRFIGMRKLGRAHSRSWTENMECSTILHELLHLTGLVDEYPESSMGYIKDSQTGKWRFVQTNPDKTAFDCRKIYSKNSIMASDELAWADSQATWDLKIEFCKCSLQDGCKSFYEK